MVNKVPEQLAKFDELWLETCHVWPPHGFTHKLHAGTKQDYNLIAIPEQSTWQSLTPVIEVASEQWSGHIPYTIPQLHITLAGLGDSVHWGEQEAELKSILNEITVRLGPINIDLHGLNILRNTIIVQIIDVEDNLKQLVSQLAKQIRKRGLIRNYRAGLHSQLWWTSIIRLYPPISDDVQSFVNSFRNMTFASTTINSIELCKNNKTFESWETLHTIDLPNG